MFNINVSFRYNALLKTILKIGLDDGRFRLATDQSLNKWMLNMMNLLRYNNTSFEYICPKKLIHVNNVLFFVDKTGMHWSVDEPTNNDTTSILNFITRSKIYEYDINKLPYIGHRNPDYLKKYINYVPSIYILDNNLNYVPENKSK